MNEGLAMVCSVCGGKEFVFQNVLWKELIDEWQLSGDEAYYINRQQGESCVVCGSNLRSIALADAIRSFLGTTELLRYIPQSTLAQKIKILEINEAGNLTSILKQFDHYVFGAYPEVDMHALPYADNEFDLVVHSDTLEHIQNPIHALKECLRVLKPGGALCFTVPIVVERLSRSREGLQKSFHGQSTTDRDDYIVHTEFGADVWTYLGKAGFAEITMHIVEYPAAIALSAKKTDSVDTSKAINQNEYDTIRESSFFDSDYYITNNPDIVDRSMDPVAHFIVYGWKRGCNPSSDFDVNYYLERYPDIKKSGMNPLLHYVKHGINEGRFNTRQVEIQKLKIYDFDGLRSIHNHDFMADPRFKKAYDRGIKAAGIDYNWYWRVHVGLWAASVAVKLEGDFVECGVNKGFLSSAIMEYMDWNTLDKQFYLLDTFCGIDMRYVTEEEKGSNIEDKNAKLIENGFYTLDVNEVKRNFEEWDNVTIIQGSIPETLVQIASHKIAFASIDMNCSPPEVAAMEYLWDRLVPGAIIVLDDYAYSGYLPQKIGMDEFAHRKGIEILSLPTGQGIMVKAG